MEVKAGYKLTEVGVIPEDWDVKILKESCIKITDGTHDTPKPIRNGIPFLTAIHVKENYIDFKNCYYLPEHIHRTIYNRCNPQLGDVLMVNIGSGTATTALIDVDYEFSLKNVALLKPNKNKLVGAFLNYYQLFQKSKIVESISSGGAQPFLSLNQIGNISFASPKTTEQTAIVKVLSETDALIQSLEKEIAKKQSIKQGTMQLLLTGKKRLPGFSGEWEVKKLGEVFSFLRTANNSRSDLSNNGEIGYIHYGDIHTKWSEFLDCTTASIPFIAEEKVRHIPLVQNGDLIVADASEDYEGLGTCIEIKNLGYKKLIAGLHTFLLRPNKNFLADGFKGYIREFEGYKNSIKRIATGISVYSITKSNLAEIEIKLPSLNEQTAIAKVLSDVDGEITALEHKLHKYKQLKQGLMQNLLTGKIRLV